MKITCLGASRCVTGSCFLLENGKKYLVDCGLFQGGKQMEALNRRNWGFDPREISALFLTHAHIDHSGRIPKLVRDGFKGRIYASRATTELCKILLVDSAHIQEMEAEWQTRKNRRRGGHDVEPLYTVEEAEACLPLFEAISLNEPVSIDCHTKVCFRNAGHILGASILEVWSAFPSDPPEKIVFSGDLGHEGQLIVKDPYPVRTADTLFIEATYGNRDHKSYEESKKELFEAIQYSYQFKEKVIIPAFAVARTQELLYILGQAFRDRLIPSMPVYLDSPLAIAATEIFRRMHEFYDEEALDMVQNGFDPFDFPQLRLSHTAQESMAINQVPGPAVIIAGNGMCTAGRVKHHLKHNLWRRGCSVVIVGFQADGTLGRRLIEGARSLKVLGENIAIRARVFTIGGFSAHAGQADLLKWLDHFQSEGMQVCVIHGEENTCRSFAQIVKDRFAFETRVPGIGDMVDVRAVRKREMAAEPIVPGLQENLLNLIRKAEALGARLQSARDALSPGLLAQITEEISKTEARLDALLGEAVPQSDKK